MKKTNDYVLVFLGVILFVIGLYMLKTVSDPKGILLTIPYICIGVGCGSFGAGMGNLIEKKALKNNPELARKIEIDQNDERTIAVEARAKSKAFDMMLFVFGALMLSFALMNINLGVLLLLVGAYLFIISYSVYYRFKYEKEM